MATAQLVAHTVHERVVNTLLFAFSLLCSNESSSSSSFFFAFSPAGKLVYVWGHKTAIAFFHSALKLNGFESARCAPLLRFAELEYTPFDRDSYGVGRERRGRFADDAVVI
jgi:hypothetical protein